MKRKTLRKLLLIIGIFFLFMYSSHVNAAAQKTGPVDILSITKYVSQDGWSWDPATKTLTLAGVDMSGFEKYSYTENPANKEKTFSQIGSVFTVPEGTTVVVKEGTQNNIMGKFSGCCFRVASEDGTDSARGITFTGGGTLNLKFSEICIYAESNITIKNVNLNFEDADICAITSCRNQDKSNANTVMTFDHANVTVKECTGGFYTFGQCVQSYKKLEDNQSLATASIYIKESNMDMDVKLDKENERNHSCFLVRNGYLNIEHSALRLRSYHSAVNVWRQYHTTEQPETLIRMQDVSCEGLEVSGASTVSGNTTIYGETFVKQGDKTALSFVGNRQLEFSHSFANAVKEMEIKKLPVCKISFDSQGGTPVEDKMIVIGKAIGPLPVTEKKGDEFLGWGSKKDLTVSDITPETLATADATYYAIWKSKTEKKQTDPGKKKETAVFSENMVETEVEKKLALVNTDKKDVPGSRFFRLRLKGKSGKRKVVLQWKKVAGADAYVVYGNACGKKMKKIATVNGNKKRYTVKKLTRGKYYKFIVAAYRKTGQEAKAITLSKSVHVATAGGKYKNPAGIGRIPEKIILQKKQQRKLRPVLRRKRAVQTHIAKFRYETDRPKVAKVSARGVIVAKRKGKCRIYVYTQNGIYKKVTVIVKKQKKSLTK